MTNAEYWRQRFEMLEEAAHQESMDYFETLEREFRKAEKSIQADIERWYGRFATNNEINLTEAKKWLHSAQLDEFRWTVEEYIAAGESLDPRWLKQLENASARVHISRLESLQLQLQQQLEVLYGGFTDDLDSLLRRIYTEGYYHTAFEIQRGLNIGWSLHSIDPKRIETMLNKPWSTDGRTFSDRIWRNKTELINDLQTRLTQALMRGDPSSVVIDAIRDRFRVSRNRAARLVMTEQAFFGSKARGDVFRELDVEQYYIVATLDELTSEICRDLDGTVLPMTQYEPGVTAPPFHPNCRTTTAPYFEDNFGERAARNANGEVYYVPADMTYREWEQRFVKGQDVPLTRQEEVAIRDYTSAKSYSLNQKLREGIALTAEEAKWTEHLDAALDKMPLYQGTVYRSVSSDRFESLEAMEIFVNSHISGRIRNFGSYLSSGVEVYDPSFEVQYIIQSRTGRDIRAFNPEEHEVLFKRDAWFLITKVSGHTIYMEEMP